jgi:hypothetical protein
VSLNHTETEDVSSGTEVDEEHVHSPNPYQASSPPSGTTSHLDPIRDDDKVMIVTPRLHNTAAVDREDHRGARSVQTTGPTHFMPSRGPEQVIDLRGSETAEVVGAGVSTRGVYSPSSKPVSPPPFGTFGNNSHLMHLELQHGQEHPLS